MTLPRLQNDRGHRRALEGRQLGKSVPGQKLPSNRSDQHPRGRTQVSAEQAALSDSTRLFEQTEAFALQ